MHGKAEGEEMKVICLESLIFRCALGDSANLCWHEPILDSIHSAFVFCYPFCLPLRCAISLLCFWGQLCCSFL